MAPVVPRSSSQREIGTSGASRKTVALVLAIITIVLAAACIGVVASHRVSAKAKDRTSSHKQAHEEQVVVTDAPQQMDKASHELLQHDRGHHNASHHNKSHQQKHLHNLTIQDHDHRDCAGGPLAACSCLLKCAVFGGSPTPCEGKNHSRKRELADRFIQKSMKHPRDMCEGMRCITECAARLGCLDRKVRADCRMVEEHFEQQRKLPEPGCNLDCEA
mmetsp:Transcript_98440/g.273847  ORF Transcript_98440/g.273847 Transcript_98440/m.273847 type:complete len:218 (-) Transcript_98440:133-786(-)